MNVPTLKYQKRIDMSEKIVGMIIPIPSYLLMRIFKEKKNKIIKVATIFKQIKPGSKVLFYSSHETHAVVGEGTIETCEIVSATNLVKNYNKYNGNLFFTKKELKEYLSQRKRSKFLVISLKEIKQYKKPVKLRRFVPMAGQYLTKRLYQKIASQQS